MITTTTNTVEGYKITGYFGLVGSEVVNGVNFTKDFGAGIRNFIGGRNGGYEKEILKAKKDAYEELVDRASQLGADAVIGIQVNFETLNQMLVLTMDGTAVKLEKL